MAKLFVEAVPRVYACCDALLTAQDIASASRFQNEQRRAEHLAWRRIVRRELGRGVVIEYDAVGAPVVDTPNIYISVSHSGSVVAVAIGSRRVGVDIERRDRGFDRVRAKYMSPTEASLSTADWWPAAVWCAKEAMYKYYGVRGVELVEDLVVECWDATTSLITGRMTGREAVNVEVSCYDDYVVAVAEAKTEK